MRGGRQAEHLPVVVPELLRFETDRVHLEGRHVLGHGEEAPGMGHDIRVGSVSREGDFEGMVRSEIEPALTVDPLGFFAQKALGPGEAPSVVSGSVFESDGVHEGVAVKEVKCPVPGGGFDVLIGPVSVERPVQLPRDFAFDRRQGEFGLDRIGSKGGGEEFIRSK
jgi:hypothetical protein